MLTVYYHWIELVFQFILDVMNVLKKSVVHVVSLRKQFNSVMIVNVDSALLLNWIRFSPKMEQCILTFQPDIESFRASSST